MTGVGVGVRVGLRVAVGLGFMVGAFVDTTADVGTRVIGVALIPVVGRVMKAMAGIKINRDRAARTGVNKPERTLNGRHIFM